MILVIAAGAFLLFVVLGWLSRQKVFKRGEWRVGAGLLSVGLLAAGLVMAVKEQFIPAGILAAAALLTAGAARSDRAWALRRKPASGSGAISESQARAILGLGPQADAAAVKAAYNRLMRVNHPDVGGTDGLAAQLNAARDRLLGK